MKVKEEERGALGGEGSSECLFGKEERHGVCRSCSVLLAQWERRPSEQPADATLDVGRSRNEGV